MNSSDGPITKLLRDCNEGKPDAINELAQLVFSHLKRLAQYRINAESAGFTLQATALADDVFLALVGNSKIDFADRTHFFKVASGMMRQMLINHAREKKAAKRGGKGKVQANLDEADIVDASIYVSTEPKVELLALDEALKRLEHFDPVNSKIVELSYFIGLSHEEISQILGLSVSAVEKRLFKAKAWLLNELTR